MKRSALALILFLSAYSLSAQTTYTGYIDKYPIELVTHIYADGVANAFYVYTNFDDPINADGTLKGGTLTLIEKDSQKKTKATFVFKGFDAGKVNIEGTWKDTRTNKELKVTLTRSFNVDDADSAAWKNGQLLQAASFKDRYFRIVLGKQKDGAGGVTGIKIFEKKTDKLLQDINVECGLMSFNNISVGDYNFDGIPDFAIFEQSYAGPNTSSLYFLFDPKKGRFFKSSFEGTSLEFDQKKKRIYEHNQCCAGTSYMDAEYKVVNNKMVLIKKTCFQYQEKSDKYKVIKCS